MQVLEGGLLHFIGYCSVLSMYYGIRLYLNGQMATEHLNRGLHLMPVKHDDDIFVRCPMCKTEWIDRDTFLRDTTLEINGYQVDFENLGMGLLYFTHQVDNCFSTLSIRAKEFFDLNPGKRYSERKTLQKDCPTYCLFKDNLERCKVQCECAFVRDLLHILQKMKHPNPR